MKFIADSMLGRLARWLRLLGHDTLYYADIDDSLLLRISREQDRTILTKDSRLVKTRDCKNFLLIEDNDPFMQLKHVIDDLDLKTDDAVHLSRCAVCNAELKNAQKADVKDSVPEYVYKTSTVFRRCPDCARTYWDGTHPGKFRKKLAEVLGKGDSPGGP